MPDSVKLPEAVETAFEHYAMRGAEADYNALRTALADAIREAEHKGRRHCKVCGSTWLDDGLNLPFCPYCVIVLNAKSLADARAERDNDG